MTKNNDPVNPNHYRNPEGVQIIEIIRFLPFSIGNAIKYTFRSEHKENAVQDLKKALWYLDDYMQNLVPSTQVLSINDDLVRKVLLGVGELEKESFTLLLEVAKNSLNNKEDFLSCSSQARNFIQKWYDSKLQEQVSSK